jgi:hypothetical protein
VCVRACVLVCVREYKGREVERIDVEVAWRVAWRVG